jgi:hypothetical protein
MVGFGNLNDQFEFSDVIFDIRNVVLDPLEARSDTWQIVKPSVRFRA